MAKRKTKTKSYEDLEMERMIEETPRMKTLKNLKVKLAHIAESLEMYEVEIDKTARVFDSLEKMMAEEDKFEEKDE
jgi:hypothetical protein